MLKCLWAALADVSTKNSSSNRAAVKSFFDKHKTNCATVVARGV